MEKGQKPSEMKIKFKETWGGKGRGGCVDEMQIQILDKREDKKSFGV